eukprot:TRINITY_DN108464_c0_g1_i1.p1 TRINITY_DN108464_c0_g1~~TRINITY_DN108464_c0_g1_i1.p1  ORF type:complete len:228 (+),score=14.12 TRINITY_DN108464_c0_g1_i1:59-685(+)
MAMRHGPNGTLDMEKLRTSSLGGPLGLRRPTQLQISEGLRLKTIHGVEGSSRNHLGPLHPVNHDDLHDLGTLYARQGQLVKAAEAYKQAWEGRQATLGADHPMTHQSMREFAEVQRRYGNRETALEILKNNECHGFSQRHPSAGSAVLATAKSHTHICPKVPRAIPGSVYPTPDPASRYGWLEPHLREQLFRRSMSMSGMLPNQQIET